ncbi:MAG TPA: heme-binding domain-containing protein [Leptospiraceae bacterium]|nr:heme-binding domain-containing protein [Leptospiraceae bacterium]HMW08515.1 heme-binding domain-containing protein [Leptospiraceae bacterium]HMX31962.1 heme-binding domain-containing protein [Leptospiraceae bacterium]HMY34347.1 heme-binding domain-containing protein [Leptospiraceae bacterium]HMZ66465.1 heme-binding domain-containing protein [Leptospiraceae bacterium]
MKRKIIISLVVVFILLQLIPINRNNPKVEADIQAPESIKSILKKSCYDCHSNETKYPLYSYIFPASVFLAHHVEEGREELNFSNWETLPANKKVKKLKEIKEEIEEKEMPLSSYTIIHREALLSKEEMNQIIEWADQMIQKNESKE